MSDFTMTPSKALAVLASGALFGFGLSLSTMIRPEIVLGFLRFSDMGLMLVMGGAVLVTLLAYRFGPRLLRQPLLGGYFHQHVSVWNRDTLVGAALFGAGWGLCGVCPVRPSPAWAPATWTCCGRWRASRWAPCCKACVPAHDVRPGTRSDKSTLRKTRC